MSNKTKCVSNVFDNSMNFLLNNYFGIGLSANEDEIIDAAINKAYDDATMRSALLQKNKEHKRGKSWDEKYQGLYKDIGDIRRKCNDFAKNECARKIKDQFIDKLKNKCSNKDAFDSMHKVICIELNNKYDYLYREKLNQAGKDNRKVKEFIDMENESYNYFTIGNAQKWVNMTLKNLYILKGVFNDKLEFIDDWISEFHIPIDNIILCGAYMRIKGDSDKKIEKVELKECKNIGVDYWEECIKMENKLESYYIKAKNADKSHVPWSRLKDYDDYLNIQNVLKYFARSKKQYPIAWECEVWLESANIMKN